MYELPTSLEVNGTEYSIRSDYRVVLDICAALSDSSLQNWEKVMAMLLLFENYDSIPRVDMEEAIKKVSWFINCGEDKSDKPLPKLMDWEKDFKWIVAPVNRIAGTEIRALDYLHWWTFVSYYYEIGDCTFAQIVNIRKKKRNNKKLEKYEREFYEANKEAVDFECDSLTDNERNSIKAMMGGALDA